MQWKNVQLIYLREMRDQLRDRRTLCLIAVLPLLLYPLLGMSFFQLSQFLRTTAAEVCVVGAAEIAAEDWLPPLWQGAAFDAALFPRNAPRQASLQVVQVAELAEKSPDTASKTSEPLALAALAAGDVQVVVCFPPGFGSRLRLAREALMERSAAAAPANIPEPQIYFNSTNEKSRLAQLRVERVLQNWRQRVMRTNLQDSQVPLEAARPFGIQPQDVAAAPQRQAAMWSKVLPFFMFIWALTGAFYPAVDLCAGEKERGTLETLLTSPAQRREIVWGKLFTVMTFSMVTAVLNLASLGVTGTFVLAQFQSIESLSAGTGLLALPPASAVVWLLVALLPVAALFGALCLACAAFARSTKEGQYYLMPLLLVILPLMMLPMSPGVEFNLGHCLIPITGLVLLLRAVIEGQYWQALPFVVPVVGVTLGCCLLAIRWAEEQFQRESVLFGESERLDVGRWLVQLVRNRTATPSFAQAIFCVGAILVVQFFVNLALSAGAATRELEASFFTQTVLVSQVLCIALPALVMTWLFTSARKKTLLLDRLPAAGWVLMTALLAMLVRPLGMEFAEIILRIYPASTEITSRIGAFEEALALISNPWLLMLLLAALPAVCEEIAFRGFILSGLRRVGHKWWAIGLSAVAFGVVHPILQQQLAAAAVGLVLGYLAVQTGSLLLCILFHALYNGLGLLMSQQITADRVFQTPWCWILSDGDTSMFQPWVLAVCLIGTVGILGWLRGLPYQHTREEQLQEAREQQFAGA